MNGQKWQHTVKVLGSHWLNFKRPQTTAFQALLICDRAKTNKRMIKNILSGIKSAHTWVFSLQVLWTLVISQTQTLIWVLRAKFYNLCPNKKLGRNVLIKYVYNQCNMPVHCHSLPPPPGFSPTTWYLLLVILGHGRWSDIPRRL